MINHRKQTIEKFKAFYHSGIETDYDLAVFIRRNWENFKAWSRQYNLEASNPKKEREGE